MTDVNGMGNNKQVAANFNGMGGNNDYTQFSIAMCVIIMKQGLLLR